ncbi:MAG: substrate-binding domain-containing protein, partial [Muribaculaceae bacterium]|nr:substrate-binding domain-containing protein [Muribaculaceae bacterium]
MKKSLHIVLLAAVISLLSVACGNSGKQYRIGVSQCSQDDWRVKVNDEINREMIFHDNAEVEIRSARDNNAKQIADIRYFMDNGFDAIIVAPNEAGAITPVIDEAYARGIPVVLFDRDINSDHYTAKVGVDNEGIGREAARYGRKLINGELNILEFQGLEGATPAAARHKGFSDEIRRMPDARIVCSRFADWYELDAEKATDSILPLNPQINLIFAHNDRMAIGAARSARRQGRGDIKVIGVDAAPNLGIQAVADSLIDATFLYPTEGHLLVQTAMNILEGKPYDVKVQIPALPAVDRSNAAIMLRQDKILQSETDKLLLMNNKANTYLSKYSAQTALLIISIMMILLLFALIFVMLRGARMQKRNRRMLAMQNEELKQQRDKQRDLYRQLDEAMQSKLVFFTNVSHDLRTPLTLIAEPIRALEKSQRINSQERNMLRIADRNIDILQRLITQILDFRKFESGKLDFNPEEVDPYALLGHWLESFKTVALRRKIRLTLNCSPHPQVQTMAVDADKIERVVYNLVSNALRHT